ncbi:hypothetical protein ZWY2020_055004 [Hordeum vulgare]|nr:hypothetical protein ZWY2020_055004 [Hordeum vulgare]
MPVPAWPRAFHRTASARAVSALTALLAGAAGCGAVVLPAVGKDMKVLAPGEFSAAASIPLPVGSVLVLNGN